MSNDDRLPFQRLDVYIAARAFAKAIHDAGIRDAEKAGIAVVHQELSLVPEFSIAENIFLGREPRRFGVIAFEDLFSRAQRVLEQQLP